MHRIYIRFLNSLSVGDMVVLLDRAKRDANTEKIDIIDKAIELRRAEEREAERK